MKRIIATTVFSLIAGMTSVASAQNTDQAARVPSATGSDTAALTEGEVRKVDKDAKKLTLRHGPILNLDMPAMTMVFQVQNPSALDQVKVGDKVKFAADKVGGTFTVTRIEAVN